MAVNTIISNIQIPPTLAPHPNERIISEATFSNHSDLKAFVDKYRQMNQPIHADHSDNTMVLHNYLLCRAKIPGTMYCETCAQIESDKRRKNQPPQPDYTVDGARRIMARYPLAHHCMCIIKNTARRVFIVRQYSVTGSPHVKAVVSTMVQSNIAATRTAYVTNQIHTHMLALIPLFLGQAISPASDSTQCIDYQLMRYGGLTFQLPGFSIIRHTTCSSGLACHCHLLESCNAALNEMKNNKHAIDKMLMKTKHDKAISEHKDTIVNANMVADVVIKHYSAALAASITTKKYRIVPVAVPTVTSTTIDADENGELVLDDLDPELDIGMEEVIASSEDELADHLTSVNETSNMEITCTMKREYAETITITEISVAQLMCEMSAKRPKH
jgi:hypothetical protein